MARKQTITTEKRLDPFAKLKSFKKAKTPGHTELENTLSNMAEHLKGAKEEGLIRVQAGTDEIKEVWGLHLLRGKCTLTKEFATSPRFELIARSDALAHVLSGQISPILTMAGGKMRVQGDIEFGKQLYRLLAADDGPIDPCEKAR